MDDAIVYDRKAGDAARAMIIALAGSAVVAGTEMIIPSTFGRWLVWGGLAVGASLFFFWLYYSFRGKLAEYDNR